MDGNGNDKENKTTITCSICLQDPKFPVAVQCGHIFCWSCLKKWLSQKSTLYCPVCKNGIEQEKIIKLFTDKEENSNEIDDRPKSKKVDPQTNKTRPNIIKRFFNGFGVFGINHDNNPNIEHQLEPPDLKEVERNLAALGIFIVSFLMLYYFFRE